MNGLIEQRGSKFQVISSSMASILFPIYFSNTDYNTQATALAHQKDYAPLITIAFYEKQNNNIKIGGRSWQSDYMSGFDWCVIGF